MRDVNHGRGRQNILDSQCGVECWLLIRLGFFNNLIYTIFYLSPESWVVLGSVYFKTRGWGISMMGGSQAMLASHSRSNIFVTLYQHWHAIHFVTLYQHWHAIQFVCMYVTVEGTGGGLGGQTCVWRSPPDYFGCFSNRNIANFIFSVTSNLYWLFHYHDNVPKSL